MLILQETTIIYYNTTCAVHQMIRGSTRQKRPSSRRAYFLLIRLSITWINEANGDYIISLFTWVLRREIQTYFLILLLFFFSFSELKTSIGGRWRWQEAGTILTSDLKKKKKEEKKRERVDGEQSTKCRFYCDVLKRKKWEKEKKKSIFPTKILLSQSNL